MSTPSPEINLEEENITLKSLLEQFEEKVTSLEKTIGDLNARLLEVEAEKTEMINILQALE